MQVVCASGMDAMTRGSFPNKTTSLLETAFSRFHAKVQVSGLGFRVAGLVSCVFGLVFWVSGLRSQVLGLRSLGFEGWVSGLGLGSRVSGFRFHVLGLGFRFSGFGSELSRPKTQT